MMTEPDSKTNGKAMIGKIKMVFVSIAKIPKTTPIAMAPVSPIKNRAG